jgi:hypothetical protein
VADGSQNQLVTILWSVVCLCAGGVMQTLLPGLQLRSPLFRTRRPFVGHIIGDTRKRIQRRDVRPHGSRQQARGDRKILVMRSRQLFAGRVRVGEQGRPGRHCQILAGPRKRSRSAGHQARLIHLVSADA